LEVDLTMCQDVFGKFSDPNSVSTASAGGENSALLQALQGTGGAKLAYVGAKEIGQINT
jgi:hypothetical protein